MTKTTTNYCINNGSSPQSLRVLEKLFTSIKVSPAFETIRRISNQNRGFTPKIIEIQASNKPASEHHNESSVPIMVAKPSSFRDRHDSEAEEISRSNIVVIKGHDDDPLNKTISDYIHKTRTKIIDITNPNYDQKKSDSDHLGTNLKKKSSFNDQFSDKISRAKHTMSSSSSASGKIVSFKNGY